MDACMYVCICVCMSLLCIMHIRACTRVHVYMYNVCTYSCVSMYMNAPVYVHIYKCICLCVYLCSVCTFVWRWRIWPQVSSSVALHLSFGDRVSHGTWWALFCLDWLVYEPWISLSTHSHSQALSVCHHVERRDLNLSPCHFLSLQILLH